APLWKIRRAGATGLKVLMTRIKWIFKVEVRDAAHFVIRVSRLRGAVPCPCGAAHARESCGCQCDYMVSARHRIVRPAQARRNHTPRSALNHLRGDNCWRQERHEKQD